MALIAKLHQLAASHPRWLALLCGLLTAMGLPPLALWPISLVGIAGLAWLVFSARGWSEAGLRGWIFGIAHFTLANNWIADAFTYQLGMPAFLGWIAVPLLSLYLAIYPALAALLARAFIGQRGFVRFAILFAGFWTITEWLRSWVFTGYAWGPLGLILLGPSDRPGLAVLLPWMGTYALSGLALLLGCLLGWLACGKRWSGLAVIAIATVVAMYLPAGKRQEGTLAFTLVQPDVRQDVLDDPSNFEEQFQRTAMLSRKQRDIANRLVLWPESGVPDYLRDGYPQRYYNQMTAGGDPAFARFRIGQSIGEGGMLLTGAVDLEIKDGRAYGARNAVTAINHEGAIVAGYDKAHLVPYGEYLALRWLLEPLGATRLVAGTIDFFPGPGPRTLDLGRWGKAGIQICYEIIFSGEVVDRDDRPDYIFNPSNEGWFGTWASPQFQAQSRMRAIEEGLPVLRATTTGISAVIDADGVVRQQIGRFTAARMDGLVPPAKKPTLFSRTGNWLPLGWALILIGFSWLALPSVVASMRRQS